MKLRNLNFTLVMFFAAFVINASFVSLSHAKISTIRAEGASKKDVAENVMKKAALKDALKNAVFLSIETVLKKDDYIKNKENIEKTILSKAVNYVVNYRILKKGLITHSELEKESIAQGDEEEEESDTIKKDEKEFYHIWIEVKIDMDILKDDIRVITGITDLGEVTDVKLVVLDILKNSEFQAFLSIVKKIDIVKSVNYKSFNRGKILLTVEVEGNAHTLLDALDDALNDALPGKYSIVPAGPTKLIVKSVEPVRY